MTSSGKDTKDPTLLEALGSRLRSCGIPTEGMAPPTAILWTDPGREWLPLLGAIRTRLPELLVLGDYEPDERTGPAIWLRCMVDGTVDLDEFPADVQPILYLPGVGRQHLRAGEDCPRSLQPLVELMFRGTLWLQKGGHDWTVTAFLSSPNGLGLDLARDQETLDALPRALREIAETPLEQFRGRRLEADDFDRLLTPDLNRDLLRWMSDPQGWRGQVGSDRWQAFRKQCATKFGMDPGEDGELVAGERLGSGEGPWDEAWARFEEAPNAYPGVPSLLRRSKPTTLFVDRSRWPDENETAEAQLRAALNEVPTLPHPQACSRVLSLEEEHGPRRAWVWARMGLAPLAGVLKPLSVLATHAQSVVGGGSPEEIARNYTTDPWRADASAWRALASALAGDQEMVQAVVRVLLETWLDEGARVFQKAVASHALPAKAESAAPEVPEGGCLLFVDGLRFDLGQALADRLEGRGCRIHRGHRWAALPTVTATAKPAVTPVTDKIEGAALPEDFSPAIASEGKQVNAARLRVEIEESGYQVLGGELGDWPASDSARGWLEMGRVDSLGHKLQERLPQQIGVELEGLEGRILSLLDAGWTSVRVVTDHGWLLLPGGLPKVDLPKHLTESRWSRCATVAGASTPSVPTAPWFWNPDERFATAPGIACFNASPAYAHGGLSLQECLIPDLLIERTQLQAIRAEVETVTWRGMRCTVEASTAGGEVRVDIREGRALGKTLVASIRTLDDEGRASLVVKDDKYEGAEATIVLLDETDVVLAQKTTRIGEQI
jgi:hypothetical protein